MSDERYVVDRRVGATPEMVEAAILQALAAARRGDLPRALPRRVHGLWGKVRGGRFTAWLHESSEGGGPDLHGWILPAGDGATRVHANVEEDRNTGPAVLGTMAFAGVLSLVGVEGAGWFAWVAVAVGAIAAIRRAAGAMDHAHARYLTAWLNGVLDGLPAAAPASADSPPGHSPATP